MALIKLVCDDLERKEAITDRLRELEINHIHRELQADATSAFKAQFVSPDAAYKTGLDLSAAFSLSASGKTAPVVTAEQALAEYDRLQAERAEHTLSMPSMPELTVDGTVWRSDIPTRLSPGQIVSCFTGPNLPTFADVNKKGEVELYSSLNLAASALGVRYVMNKLQPSADDTGMHNNG